MTSMSRLRLPMRLEQLLAVSPLYDEGVHALSRHSRGQHPPARGAGHVRVLALRVDDVGGHAASDAPEHPSLVAKDLPLPDRASTAVFWFRCVPSQGS